MSDLWAKANEIGDAIGKLNPVFQGIGAFTKMQVDHFDNNLARNRNKVTGELEINPIMRFLGKRPEYVEKAYGRDLRSTPEAKAVLQAGGSLKNDKDRYLSVDQVAERSDLAASDIGQKAQLLNIPIKFGTDSAISLAGKVERKELTNQIEALGGVVDADSSVPTLRSQLRQKERFDKYGSLTTGADGKPRGSAQLEQDVITEAEGKRLQQQTDIEGKAKYGSRYGQGKGTAELANELALERQVQELENQFNSKGAKYDRFRDQRNFARDAYITDRAYNRGVYESDRSFNRNTFESDRNFSQRVLENNNALDLRKFELELQRDMSEDARQHDMIQNLVGGLFNLGSLL